jgi:lipocalin
MYHRSILSISHDLCDSVSPPCEQGSKSLVAMTKSLYNILNAEIGSLELEVLFVFLSCIYGMNPSVTDSALSSGSGSSQDWPSPEFAPLGHEDYTVEKVMPERFIGLWYEISSSLSENNCTGTTVSYTIVDPNTYGIINECAIDTLDGPSSRIEGIGEAIDNTHSHLIVSLFGQYTNNYYIVEMDGTGGDDPYDFIVVKSTDPEKIWILGRYKNMSKWLYDGIVQRLAGRDFDVDNMIMTEH